MNRTRNVCAAGLLLAIGAATAPAAEQRSPSPTFRYETPGGAVCVVDRTGLSRVEAGGQTVAHGGVEVVSAAALLGKDKGRAFGRIEQRSVEVLGDRHARVRHDYDAATVVYDYRFDGADLHIAARVTNRHPSQPIPAVMLSGPAFNSPPERSVGIQPLKPGQPLTEQDGAAMHPSAANPIGGAMLRGDRVGIGLAPLDAGRTATLLGVRQAAKGEPTGLRYVVDAPVPAEGARTYHLLVRLAGPDAGWKRLLEPWKRHLAAMRAPEARYAGWNRPIAFHPVASSKKAVSESNPRGYAKGEVRFDKIESVQQYADRIAPKLKEADALAVVYQSVGGHDPKGLGYMSTFHFAPPAVHENFKKVLTPRFEKAGLRTAAGGYPDRFDIYVTRNRNEYLPLNPDQPNHLKHMWDVRLEESMEKMGVSAFFFPDFGDGRDDAKMMRHYREKAGAELPTLATQVTDTILFDTPGCLTARPNPDGDAPAQLRIAGAPVEPAMVERLRWLVPGASLYANIEGFEPGGQRAVEAIGWLYERGIGVMAEEALIVGRAGRLAEARDRAVEAGAFKPAKRVEPADLTLSPPSAAPAEPMGSETGRVTWSTPGGIELTVTQDGLSEITLDGRTLAEGQWRARLDKPFHGEPKRKHFTTVDAQTVKLRHVHQHATVTYTYRFEGRDLTVEAYLENTHPTEPVGIGRFGQLTFHFRGKHDKSQWSKHSKWGWLNSPGHRDDMGHMHPGWKNRMGGSWGADEDYGVGATPLKAPFERTLLRWRGRWSDDDRRLSYSHQQPVSAGGAQTFAFKLRLSTNTDWRHLLTPYKKYLHRTYGDQRYEGDQRWTMQAMVAAPGGAWVSEDSPLGYNKRSRLDTEKGTRQFAREKVGQLNEGNGKGLLMWGIGGHQPRGMIFRTDFDVIPAPTEESLPILDRTFRDSDRRWGVCARLNAITYRWKWNKDNLLPIHGDHPAYQRAKRRRFRRMIDRGATMFYIDAAGHRLREVKMIAHLRKHMPDGINFYAEHACDILMPYSGMYCGIRYKKKRGLHIHWGLDGFWKVVNWLMRNPDTTANAHIHPWPKDSDLTKRKVYRWMYERKLAPLEPKHKIKDVLGEWGLPAHQADYVTPDGRWKPKAGSAWPYQRPD